MVCKCKRVAILSNMVGATVFIAGLPRASLADIITTPTDLINQEMVTNYADGSAHESNAFSDSNTVQIDDGLTESVGNVIVDANSIAISAESHAYGLDQYTPFEGAQTQELITLDFEVDTPEIYTLTWDNTITTTGYLLSGNLQLSFDGTTINGPGSGMSQFELTPSNTYEIDITVNDEVTGNESSEGGGDDSRSSDIELLPTGNVPEPPAASAVFCAAILSTLGSHRLARRRGIHRRNN